MSRVSRREAESGDVPACWAETAESCTRPSSLARVSRYGDTSGVDRGNGRGPHRTAALHEAIDCVGVFVVSIVTDGLDFDTASRKLLPQFTDSTETPGVEHVRQIAGVVLPAVEQDRVETLGAVLFHAPSG